MYVHSNLVRKNHFNSGLTKKKEPSGSYTQHVQINSANQLPNKKNAGIITAMSQSYQILSKENNSGRLPELLSENQALQFVRAIFAQEVRKVSDSVDTPELITATFRLIVQELKTVAAQKMNSATHSIFSGKK